MTTRSYRRWTLFLVSLLLAMASAWERPEAVHALPSGGQVVGGTAGIQTNGTTMTIQQQSNNALLHWQGFSIGAHETVQFLQPSATSLAVNRVLGSDPSIILGNLLANGRVFLLNPNGVVFGPGSVVNVGGLLATTLSLKSYDLDKSRFTFAQDPTKAFAAVVNQGTLRAADHGFVVLTAPGVVNEGLIVAKFGQVGLGAGTQMAVDFRGDGLIQYAVDGKVMGQVTDPSGRPLSAAVTNAGRIEADGGTVLLTAHASSAVVSSVINQTGVIHARRLESQGGEIVLKGGDEGAVMVAGTLDATAMGNGQWAMGNAMGEKGGRIDIRGEKIALTETAQLDVSGDAGGGSITVGGGFQGKDGGPNSQQTAVMPGATLLANANTAGDGGTVVVWADGATAFGGHIAARGGAEGGNSGFAEVSGKEGLSFQGTADLQAPLGQTGTLLLDPKFIIIQAGGVDPATGQTFGVNPAGTATISGANLGTAINSANVVLQANTDATFDDNVTATTSGNGLTVQAGRSIIFNANRVLTLNNGPFTAIINDNGSVTANRDAGPAQFVMNSGSQILTNNGGFAVLHGTKDLTSTGEIRIGNGTGAATISTGTGFIQLTGQGRDGTDNAHGIQISNGSVLQTTTGNMSINGTGGAGVQNNFGVRIEGAGTMVTTSTGAIAIIGQGGIGGGAVQNNLGVGIGFGAKVISTGTVDAGNITITGTGGGGTADNGGVGICCAGTQVSSAGGQIIISGLGGGTGSSSEGIVVSDGALITSTGTTGHITLTGIGADLSPGITTEGPGTSTIGGASTQGTITLQTRTINGTESINLANLTVQGTGNLQLQPINTSDSVGINGGPGIYNLSSTEMGFFVPGFNLIFIGSGIGTGLVTVNGLTRPESVILQSGLSGGTVSVTAPITLTNPSSFFQIMAGRNVLINPGANLTTSEGSIALQGNVSGASTGTFVGVDVNGATISNTKGGITLIGTGGKTGANNFGIQLRNAAHLMTTEGTIALQGTGGSGGTSGNVGVHLETASTLTTTSGQISVGGFGGTASGIGNRGVDILGTGTNVTSTSGLIDISGMGGANASFTYGIVMAQGRVATGGQITLNGQGGSGGPSNVATLGVLITNAAQIEGTGTAIVSVNGSGGTGTATSATNGEVGVFMHGQNGTFIRSADGELSINGSGNGTGIGGQGVILRAGALVEATGTGNVLVQGTGSFTGSANSNGVHMIEAGTTVRSNAGNINMNGAAHGATDSNNNIGVAIASGALVQKTGVGDGIFIVGFGGGDGAVGANNFGVALLSATTHILTTNGAIGIDGIGGIGGAAGVTAQGGFVVGAPGIPCASCASSVNLNAGSGTISITSNP